VWLDWAYHPQQGWAQCGPYSVQSDWGVNTTGAAVRTYRGNPIWFRACGRTVAGDSNCTEGWWP
jgi:hypothetical protein